MQDIQKQIGFYAAAPAPAPTLKASKMMCGAPMQQPEVSDEVKAIVEGLKGEVQQQSQALGQSICLSVCLYVYPSVILCPFNISYTLGVCFVVCVSQMGGQL